MKMEGEKIRISLPTSQAALQAKKREREKRKTKEEEALTEINDFDTSIRRQ